jgi:hypothetical protein
MYICVVCIIISETHFLGGTPKIIVNIPRKTCLWKRNRIKRRLLAHGDCSTNFQLPDKYFRDISRHIYNFFFCGILKKLCIYPTIFLGTLNGVLWNPRVQRSPVWVTLAYMNSGVARSFGTDVARFHLKPEMNNHNNHEYTKFWIKENHDDVVVLFYLAQ